MALLLEWCSELLHVQKMVRCPIKLGPDGQVDMFGTGRLTQLGLVARPSAFRRPEGIGKVYPWRLHGTSIGVASGGQWKRYQMGI